MKEAKSGVLVTTKGVFKLRKNGRMELIIEPGTERGETVRCTPPSQLTN